MGVSLGGPRILRLHGPSWTKHAPPDESKVSKETEYADILLESGSVYIQR